MIQIRFKPSGPLLDGTTMDDLIELTEEVFNGSIAQVVTVTPEEYIILKMKWGHYLERL